MSEVPEGSQLLIGFQCLLSNRYTPLVLKIHRNDYQNLRFFQTINCAKKFGSILANFGSFLGALVQISCYTSPKHKCCPKQNKNDNLLSLFLILQLLIMLSITKTVH